MTSTTLFVLVGLVANASPMVLKAADGRPLEEAALDLSLDDAVRSRVARQTSSTCSNGYESIAGSTMCLQDSASYIPGTAGVSAADRVLILATHNSYRADVNPAARSMTKMYWNEDLAKLAEKWAKQCLVGHESHYGKSRFIPAHGMESGQNGGFGYVSWNQTIAAWHGEVANFVYGQGSRGGVVGHYTQIVQEKSILIGCGFAKCTTGYGNFYFCNYLDAQYNTVQPYTSGTHCSGCPSTCDDRKLCDCGGKFCFNGGGLDLNTCQCACKTPFIGPTCQQLACNGKQCQNGGVLNVNTCSCQCTPLYSGLNCETKTCPAKDPYFCGDPWTENYCRIYYNVPDICPRMCGKC